MAQPAARASEAVVTTAVNQSMATYRGTPNERILMSTMQAINYMELGDMESARIELNRAHDWQQDAELRYAKEIEREQAKIAEEAEDEALETETDEQSGLPTSVASHYAYLQDLRGYGAYRNPFPSHLRGVFLLARGADIGCGARSAACWSVRRHGRSRGSGRASPSPARRASAACRTV